VASTAGPGGERGAVLRKGIILDNETVEIEISPEVEKLIHERVKDLKTTFIGITLFLVCVISGLVIALVDK
jgi:hypothetical protein